MKRNRIVIFMFVSCVLLSVVLAFTTAGAQVMTQRPEDARFQLLADEPIAAPDNRSVVAGWSVLVFKDRHTSQCFAAFRQLAAISTVPVACE
jgi:hypothetical protein